jgi:hypothetical protein
MLSGWTSFFLSFFSFFIFFWLYFYLYLQFFISSFHSGFDFPICISTQMSFEANRSSMQIRYVYRGGDRSFLFYFFIFFEEIKYQRLRSEHFNLMCILFHFPLTFFFGSERFSIKKIYMSPLSAFLWLRAHFQWLIVKRN